jgi:dihydroorotate dehydrogenase
MVFGGLDLLDRLKRGLVAAVRAQGKTNIAQLVGSRTADWAEGPGQVSL